MLSIPIDIVVSGALGLTLWRYAQDDAASEQPEPDETADIVEVVFRQTILVAAVGVGAAGTLAFLVHLLLPKETMNKAVQVASSYAGIVTSTVVTIGVSMMRGWAVAMVFWLTQMILGTPAPDNNMQLYTVGIAETFGPLVHHLFV